MPRRWLRVCRFSVYIVSSLCLSATLSTHLRLTCILAKHTNQSEQGGFPWKVGPNEFDLSVSYIFFLTLGPYASLSNATTSHYFNMTYPNAAASSSATPTLTTSTSLTSQSTTLDAMAPPSSSTSTPATPAKSLDIALPVGLAVGLGVPVIALLAFVAFKKNKHKAKNSGGAESSHLSNGLPSDARSSQPVFGELPGYSKQPVNAINASSPPRPRPVGDMMPVEMHAP